MDGQTAEEDFSSLSTIDKLQHKSWKARLSAYEELAQLFRKTMEDSDFYTYQSYLKKMVTDTNAIIQEVALTAVLEYVSNAPNASSTREQVIPSLVEKCFGAARAGTKQKATDIVLLYAEIDQPDSVIEYIIPGTTVKQPKVVTHTVFTLKELVRQFGAKKVNPKPILKLLPKLFGHTDKNVRAEAFSLTVETYRWLSKALNVAMVKILENSNRNVTFSALLSILSNCSSGLRPGDSPAAKETKYTELIMKCLWKLAKTIRSSLQANQLNPDELLYEINRFFIMTPPTEWKRRAAENVPLGEIPLRTVKTLLLQLVTSLGDSVFQHLTLIENPQSSSVYPYLHHMLEGCRKKDGSMTQQQMQQPPTSQLQQQQQMQMQMQQSQQSEFMTHSRTSSLSRPSSIVSLKSSTMARSPSIASHRSNEGESVNSMHIDSNPSHHNPAVNNHVQPMQVDEHPSHDTSSNTLNELEMHNALQRIFAKIGTRDQTKQGIIELYEFQKAYPAAQSKVNTYLSQTGTYFQSYIRRGLSNLAAEDNEMLAASTIPMVPTTTTATATATPMPATSVATVTAASSPSPTNISTATATNVQHFTATPSTMTATNAGMTMAASVASEDQHRYSFEQQQTQIRTTINENPRPSSFVADDAADIKLRLLRLRQKFGYKNERINDANALLVGTAANCIENIAQGLRTDFGKYKPVVAPVIVEKLKERKAAILEQLANALNSVFATVPMSELVEDITAASKHKNAQVRSECFKLVSRRLREVKEMPDKPEIKAFGDMFKKLLDDADANAREAGAEGLGTMMKLLGEKPMLAFTDGLDDIKMGKIKEFYEKVTVKAKAPKKPAAPPPKKPAAAPPAKKTASKTAPPKRKPPARLAGAASAKKPALSSKPKPAAAPAASKKGAKQPAASAPEETEYNFLEDAEGPVDISGHLNKIVAELGDANWKVRKEALDKVQGIIKGAHNSIKSSLGTEFPGVLKQRLNDTNKNLQIQAVEITGALAMAMDKSFEKHLKTFAAPVAAVLSDNKANVRAAGVATLEQFRKACGLEQMAGVFGASLANESPALRKDLLTWLNTAVPDDTNAANGDWTSLISPLFSCLQDRNADVRKAAQTFLPLLVSLVGYDAVCRKASELKASQRQTVMPLIESARGPAPASSKGGSSQMERRSETPSDDHRLGSSSTSRTKTVKKKLGLPSPRPVSQTVATAPESELLPPMIANKQLRAKKEIARRSMEPPRHEAEFMEPEEQLPSLNKLPRLGGRSQIGKPRGLVAPQRISHHVPQRFLKKPTSISMNHDRFDPINSNSSSSLQQCYNNSSTSNSNNNSPC
ncbi:hypothetical protein RMCBS344292_06766 [Rhizopus microsporus]|nr:hypothetical protein RMCBS344292_06766 [Rhizopus microsporus]